MLSYSEVPLRDFASHVFGCARLGDERRRRRAVAVAGRMAERPGLSFSAMFDSAGQSKAAYRLMANKAVTPAALLGPHFEQVRDALPRDGATVLLIEDTSEIDYVFREPIEGLSRVGPGNADHQGFLLHTTIAALPLGEAEGAMRAPVRVLGLAHQEYYLRPAEPVSKKAKSSYKARANRESELFERSTKAIGQAPAGSRFVRVADRGADIYLVLKRYQDAGHGFVVRARHDRALEPDDEQQVRRISEALEGAAWCAEKLDVEMRTRPGQEARTALVSVRMAPVRLAAPRYSKEARQRLGLTLDPINCTVVHLLEDESTAPPPAAAPKRKKGTKLAKRAQPSGRLEWKLLVSWPVENFAQACEAASFYATRWIIEEFHRILKEGMGAERLQMETGHSLMNTVAMMCPIALRTVDLRERTRIAPHSPASESGLAPLELALLGEITRRKIETLEDATRAIGKLGGHLGRKSDGMPGTKTLFLGLRRLQDITIAAQAYESLRKKGLTRSG